MAITAPYVTLNTVRDVDPSSVGMMEGAFFVSRTELLDWVNNTFNLSLNKIEQAASGAVYLQIIDALYGGGGTNVVPMAKVKWNCKFDYEYIQNYKLLQSVFNKQGIKKYIEVDKLIKGKYQDNLQFLQWMKAFYDRQAAQLQTSDRIYNALERRKLAGPILPEWAQPKDSRESATSGAAAATLVTAAAAVGSSTASPVPCCGKRDSSTSSIGGGSARRRGAPPSTAAPSTHSSSQSTARSSSTTLAAAAAVGGLRTSHGSESCAQQQRPHAENNCSDSVSVGSSNALPLVRELQDEVKRLKELAVKLELEAEQAWLERDFYFRKLRRLELMSTAPGAVVLHVEEVLAVLYATDDDKADVNTADEFACTGTAQGEEKVEEEICFETSGHQVAKSNSSANADTGTTVSEDAFGSSSAVAAATTACMHAHGCLKKID